MATGGDLSASIILRFLADQARREMTATGGDLRTLGSAAEEAGRKASAAGSAIGQTGAAAQGAAPQVGALNQAVTATVGQSISLSAQLGRNATAMAGVQNAASGLTRSVKDQVEAMRAEQREAANLKAELDEVRARFNPLFAASRQYEMALRDIADAERMGAISASEAAAARDRAAQTIAPMNNAMRGTAQATGAATAANANLFAQWNDIAVMMAAGQNPMQLAMQQGTQVSQMLMTLGGGTTALRAIGTSFLAMLNPISLATIGIIAFGAAGVQWLMSLGGETKTFEDRLDDLNDTLGRMKSNLDLLGNTRLSETFGNLTGEVRALAQGMLELDRAAELKQLEAVIDSFLSKEIEESWGQFITRSLVAGFAASAGGYNTAAAMQPEVNEASNYAALGVANTYDDFTSRTDAIGELARAGDVDGVLTGIRDLQAAMAGGGPFSDMSEEARKLLLDLMQTGVKIAEVEAFWNGSARAEAISHQIDQMVRGYAQQAELAQAVLQHGENSAEVEALRNRHAREALRIRLEEMGVLQGSAEEQRAMAELEAAQAAEGALAARERQQAMTAVFTDMRRQEELSRAILQYGEDAAEVEEIRGRHADEVLRARLEELGMGPLLIDMALSLAGAERDRARAIREATAQRTAGDMLADLREEAAINAAILAHGEDSLQVKELQIAAERRAFEATLATLQVTEAVKEELRAAWEAARGLASADPFGSLAAGRDYLRGQQERIERLRLEQGLLGQNEEVRTRVIALWQAERDMIREGIDLASARAGEIRAAAMEEVTLTRTLERQQEAWQKVQSSAETAIDSITEKLMGGDVEGALEALAGEIAGMFTQLAVTNPLKNALLGTNYGTIQDVGGLGGIWGRLTGQADPLTATMSSMGSSVGSMQVTAANVTIAGPGALSFMAGATGTGAANLPGGLSGSAGVQQQIWSFFAGKGLQPHQIAAIMGNVQAESAFNPLAVGDGGTSFGLFQHHAGRGQGLLSAVGGQAGLGNVNAQLEYVWQELLTSENGVLQRLLASSNVQDATTAFVGFERPQGWSASDPTGAHNWAGRLGGAEAALARFGTTATDATANLGTLGNGFDVFGNALAQGLNGLATGGGQGGLMGFLGTIASGIAGSLGIPGFAAGGDHRGGLRIVGENGPELEFTGPSRIMDAELTRSILTSRPPVAANAPASVIQLQPVLVNNTSRQVDLEVEETTDARGQRQQRFVISDVVGDGLATPGGKAARNMKQVYGVGRPTRRRS